MSVTRTSTQKEGAGQPSTPTTDDNIQQAREMVTADRRVTIDEHGCSACGAKVCGFTTNRKPSARKAYGSLHFARPSALLVDTISKNNVSVVHLSL
ncbi:hypothetical protein NPIL_385691 [Nephila pilipes]|uniref:Uncharacterized protein n=1 Tax=Nephila pilipes TaxID=299642 RepID=A0A8X6U028_NEPPI|nr:hypothetical protein NPIL_385691 [Nephila pilipes]